jgi:ABC-2 type transport system ATP-binding protein
VVFDAEKLLYAGAKAGLYKVLSILEPLPLVQIKQDQADLTQVFLKLIQENNYSYV